jgi:beta-lactamase regulating signal transducer with metallopeptidase domain
VSVPHVPVHVVTALAAALLHSLWQCAVLAAAADAMLRLLHRRSAALRHAAGMGFLVSMALVPAWAFLRGLSLKPGGIQRGILGVAAIPPLGSASDVLARTISNWAAPLCAVWIVGVVVMLVRQVGGLWWIDRLDRRVVHELPPKWLERLHALQHTMGISRAIVVRLADDVLVPFTARLFRPIIWVPRALLTRLSQSQIEALLAHELAHIRRLDWLWNGLQCVIEALLFFHPGVWWLSRRIREERERACDAIAATVCADPVSLAEALAALAHVRQPRPRLLLAANAHPLHDRINHLLTGASTPARSSVPLGLLAVMATTAVLAAPAGTTNSVALRRNTPIPMVEVSTMNERVGQSAAEVSARRSSDTGTRAPDAGRATAAVIDRNQLAHDTEAVAREDGLRAAEDTIRAREQAVRVAEDAIRGPEEAARAAEDILRDREQAARDAEGASPGHEELARYREQTARAREAVARARAQTARIREGLARHRAVATPVWEGIARVAEHAARDAADAARAVDAPTAARAVDAPTAARAVDAPTAARAVDAPTAARAVDAPTATRAVDAVKSMVPYAAHSVQALKVRTPPRKGSPAPL